MTQISNAVALAVGAAKSARPYQDFAKNEVCRHIRDKVKKICLVQDTGTGKTFSAKYICESLELREALGLPHDHRLKVLWIAHRSNLIDQARIELDEFGDNPLIEFIGQMTTKSIPDDAEYDIVIHDEAHHEPTASFQYMLPRLENFVQIGLTAETDREDMKLLKYSKIVSPMTREEAEDQNWILRPDLHTIINPSKDMVLAITRLNEHFPEYFPRTLVFVSTVSQGKELIEYFKTQINPRTGNLYRVADGVTLVKDALINELKAFSNEELDIIITVDKLGEGTDLRNVEGVIIGRNVNSRTLLNQMVGRAVRTDVPICRVIEFIHPLRNNLTVTEVVGSTQSHKMYNFSNGRYVHSDYNKL